MKLIAYVRVSTQEQARGDSAERQVAMIKAYCVVHKLELSEVIIDDGYSGSSERRPGWRRLVQLLVGGASGIIAVDLSRLHRNAGDAIRFAETHVVKRGRRLVLLAEQVDLSTAAGKLQYNIMVSAAQFHSDQTKEKTRRALDLKRSKGEKLGGVTPYGYIAEAGKLVPDVEEQRILAIIVAWHAAGMGARAIATKLTEDQVPSKTGNTWWQPKTVQKILRRLA